MIEQVVAGRFQLLAQAGVGGMGAVYRARDLATGATVAVKILTGREVREAQRFDQEGAILAGLVHPAIVRYIAHGIADSGARYIAMEWLDGEDLASRLEREHPTVAETVTLARRTAEALAYAHKRGVVHRDIKPGNLFLPGGAVDRLKVLDFGIARLTSGAGRLTRTGKVIGTPGYMAPELVRGAREITPRADVFSLGCVMFQCLTGRAVFEAEAPTALLAKILLVEAPRVRDLAPHVPASVDECVGRMLAKNPEDRLADAGEILELLSALGPLGDARAVGAAGMGGATIALTASERRIACVVIAGPSATGERRWSGDTPPAGTLQTDDEAVLAGQLRRLMAIEEDLARRHGARIHPLPDGSVVVSLPEPGFDSDHQERESDECLGDCRPGGAERKHDPEVIEHRADRGGAAEGGLQGDPADNRREHQRQSDQSADHASPRQGCPREQVGQRDADDERDCDRDDRALDGEAERREHVRRHQLRRQVAPVDMDEQPDERQRDEQHCHRGRDDETEEGASRDAPGHDGFRNPSSSNCA